MQYLFADCQQLNQFYKQNRDKARAKLEDLMYAAINEEGEICSVLRLLPYDGFLFLRSVLTTKESRGQGIASGLLEYALAQQSGLIYTLPTPQALPLYQRLGFQTLSKHEIPAQLLASYRRFRQTDNGPTVMVINASVR
jgi:GNAT superfamily N-acetyltransferase